MGNDFGAGKNGRDRKRKEKLGYVFIPCRFQSRSDRYPCQDLNPPDFLQCSRLPLLRIINHCHQPVIIWHRDIPPSSSRGCFDLKSTSVKSFVDKNPASFIESDFSIAFLVFSRLDPGRLSCRNSKAIFVFQRIARYNEHFHSALLARSTRHWCFRTDSRISVALGARSARGRLGQSRRDVTDLIIGDQSSICQHARRWRCCDPSCGSFAPVESRSRSAIRYCHSNTAIDAPHRITSKFKVSVDIAPPQGLSPGFQRRRSLFSSGRSATSSSRPSASHWKHRL
ncbi:hypothetical protein C8J56DRAFT_946255 [Mycena floridula]|nr:hypothetical protein C8J56DRAFT_946255 [Mycena floridula]